MKNISVVLTIFALLMPSLPVPAADLPDVIVKSTVDEVMDVIRKNKDKQMLRDLAEHKVVPHFDFRRMTQKAVGNAWQRATPAQQEALQNGFRTLLVNTYVNALNISATGSETVDVKPLRVASGQNEVTVKTTVTTPGKQPVPIDYNMDREQDGWKVIDVVVDNVSLVINYRGTFSEEINRSGIDGLIRLLDQKNRTLASS
ncbi:MAG TPA: ABC transporter substrate-binding protein [Burkholderiales bacterium]|nr:ABC transporter substrate-binding protein [Burkholderiales bacterium]